MVKNKNLVVIYEIIQYFICIIVGLAAGFILGIISGGNFGFNLSLFGPGYEGGLQLGSILGVFVLVIYKIIFLRKAKFKDFTITILGFILGSFIAYKIMYLLLDARHSIQHVSAFTIFIFKWIPLIMIFVLPLLGLVLPKLLIKKKNK